MYIPKAMREEVFNKMRNPSEDKGENNVPFTTQNVIVKLGKLYGEPCVLFRHKNGFAWQYKDEIRNLGDIGMKRAIQKFDWNFAL